MSTGTMAGQGGAAGSGGAMRDAGDPDGRPPAVSAWVGPRLVVGVGLGGRRTMSRDGMTWGTEVQDERATGESAKTFHDAAFGKDILVAVGGGCPNGACVARVSTFNGDHWTDRALPADAVGPLTGVAFGEGAFVAVGPAGTVITSRDGKAWTSLRPLPIGGAPSAPSLKGARKIAHGQVGGAGIFVIVGDGGLRSRSTDGVAWSAPIRGFPGASEEVNLLAVEIGGGVVVAGGTQGRRIRSRDGLDWTDPALGGVPLTSIVFAQGTFMAYGEAMSAWVSTDGGVKWMPQTLISPPSAGVETGMMGSARLYVGYSQMSSMGAVIKTSTDGIAWTHTYRSNPDTNALVRFVFAGP
jgi:hypothetical protein